VYIESDKVPTEMQSGTMSRVGPENGVSDGGAHWRHLANTIKPSVCGGDVAK